MISVIVPVYNVSEFLSQSLDSIINQTYKDIEIILVDDGSTDESGKICDVYASNDSRVRVIHKSNGGLSSARNAGLDIALGDYITFVDSDDIIEECMLEEMYKYAKSDDYGFIACGINNFFDGTYDEQWPFMNRGVENVLEAKKYIKGILERHYDNAACGKLYSSKLLKKIRFKYGVINEDILFNIEFLSNARLVFVTDSPYYKYRLRKGSITRQVNPRLHDFVDNAFEVKNMIVSSGEKELYPFCDGYIYGQIADFVSIVSRYNAKNDNKQYIVKYKDYLNSHLKEAYKNPHWSLIKKMKYAVSASMPFAYRWFYGIISIVRKS